MSPHAPNPIAFTSLLGQRLAGGVRIDDLLVSIDGAVWPVVAVRAGDACFEAHWHRDVLALGAAVDPTNLVSLRRDVLDRQVVDVDDRRVVRVGDIALVPREGKLEAVALEVGVRPLLRRIGLGALTHRVGPDLLHLDDVTVTENCLVAHTSREHISSIETHHLARLIRRLPHGMKHDVLRELPSDRAHEVTAHIASKPHRPRWRRYRTPHA